MEALDNKSKKNLTGVDIFLISLGVLVLPLGVIAYLYGVFPFEVTDYNSKFQNNFMASCSTTGTDQSACACGYDALKNNFSYTEAVQIDADLRNNTLNGDIQKWQKIAEERCTQHNTN
jgi:hypothetical protein